MPTPVQHLAIAEQLLRDSTLPGSIRDRLLEQRGAFLFGNTAPDVQTVAENMMRPVSRYFDEHEHEIPWDYIEFMHTAMKAMGAGSLAPKEKGNGHAEEQKEKRLPIAYQMLASQIEMLAWGDVGMYLITPGGGLVCWNWYGSIEPTPISSRWRRTSWWISSRRKDWRSPPSEQARHGVRKGCRSPTRIHRFVAQPYSGSRVMCHWLLNSRRLSSLA